MSGGAGAILLAAGQGRRLGHDKSMTEIAGRPVLAYGLEVLLKSKGIEKVVVTVREDVRKDAADWVAKNLGSEAKRVEVIVGGRERQDSVGEGLRALGAVLDWVSGASPFSASALV